MTCILLNSVNYRQLFAEFPIVNYFFVVLSKGKKNITILKPIDNWSLVMAHQSWGPSSHTQGTL